MDSCLGLEPRLSNRKQRKYACLAWHERDWPESGVREYALGKHAWRLKAQVCSHYTKVGGKVTWCTICKCVQSCGQV